ncbi:hypothetical protein ACFO5R_17165 [Halosolutus amylolyticus]|uniref:Uncharacterized protein n=1 Tax=Halosolutus amylolyticus TaxID=2932267 RepID=A0ABD5PUM8_9EURY|nr:hypothetical protein [Halosolutus amylolyticus]
MAAGSTTDREPDSLSVQCLQRACEVEREQRARAIERLESAAGDDLTDDQRVLVADLARSLTATLAPVVIETAQRSCDTENERTRARDRSDD